MLDAPATSRATPPVLFERSQTVITDLAEALAQPVLTY